MRTRPAGTVAWLSMLALVLGLVMFGPAAIAQTSGCGSSSYPPTTGQLQISATVVVIGGSVTASGSGFAPGATVQLTLQGPQPSTAVVSLGTAVADGSGNFSTTVTLPASAVAGTYTIIAAGQGTNTGCRTLQSAQITVAAQVTTPAPVPTLVLGVTILRQGQSTTATGIGCAPNTPVAISLDSSATNIGSSTSNSQGQFTGTITAPTNATLGAHTVIATCNNAQPISAPVTIVSGTQNLLSLPFTGANIVPWVLAAITLIVAGTALLLFRRRSHGAQGDS
jgi:hypothetical protein